MSSWTISPQLNVALGLTAFVYIRGWLRAPGSKLLASFLGGLIVIFLALESPLDAFDQLFLSAHMTQHLLLMMVAPAMLLYGRPTVTLLRGLPRPFVKEGLGPFLAWPALQHFLARLSSPPVAWLLFAFSTIGWHLPRFYETALRSPEWHNVQHASFFWTGILFWWPVLNPSPRHGAWPRWALIPYLLMADLVNTALSAFLIFSDRVLYPSYEAVRLSGLNAHTDQALAGAIMWVPGSVFYLLPAAVIAARQFTGELPRTPTPALVQITAPRPAILRWKAPLLRRIAQCTMLLLAIAVIWDGFTGTQIAPLNLAGVLPWIHWRAFSLLALLFVGNLFCMVCPFTFVRDLARKILPQRAHWPRELRSKWLPFALILIYLWAYEALSLWNRPGATAFLIAGYFAAALLIDSIFRGASFCKYVCPIGQFHFISSLVSPGEIRILDNTVCNSCRTHDCIKGNARHRGCELGLFLPKKAGNMDCTYCLDCVQACPTENVTFAMTVPAKSLFSEKLSHRTDITALAILIIAGAFVNAAAMTPAWIANAAWPALFVAPTASAFPSARRFVFALLPLGVSMWTAHLTFHLAASLNITSVHGLQLLILDGGLLTALYTLWRIARTVRKFLPWALLAAALYTLGVWILLQPMQMRGTMQ